MRPRLYNYLLALNLLFLYLLDLLWCYILFSNVSLILKSVLHEFIDSAVSFWVRIVEHLLHILSSSTHDVMLVVYEF